MGTIKLKLYTITKNFEKYGVETWFSLDPTSNESEATPNSKQQFHLQPTSRCFYCIFLFRKDFYFIENFQNGFFRIKMDSHEQHMNEFVSANEMNNLVHDYLMARLNILSI